MTSRKARRAWNAAIRKHVRRGHVYNIEFRHDHDCLIYSTTRVCTCSPDRVLMSDEGTTLATVRGAGPFDPLELMGAAQ